jgi:hypothetical protein
MSRTSQLNRIRNGSGSLENFRLGNFPAFEARGFEPDFNFFFDCFERFFVSRAISQTAGQLRHGCNECSIGFAPTDLHAITRC